MDVHNSMTPYSGKLQINDSDLSRIEVFFVLFFPTLPLASQQQQQQYSLLSQTRWGRLILSRQQQQHCH
jgi:hypothetical protein